MTNLTDFAQNSIISNSKWLFCPLFFGSALVIMPDYLMGCGGGLTSGFGEHRAYSCSTTNVVADFDDETKTIKPNQFMFSWIPIQ